MSKILIISASVRNGRKSHRVALYLEKFLQQNELAETSILDLAAYQFPIFEERLKFIEIPTAAMLELAQRVTDADGVIIVTPEYNGGYPASLKNVIDLLYAEWKHKPIGIATVSGGAFGGTQVITSLLFTLWKIGALMVPATFPVPVVQNSFNEEGVPEDQAVTDKRAHNFVKELLFWIKSKNAAAE